MTAHVHGWYCYAVLAVLPALLAWFCYSAWALCRDLREGPRRRSLAFLAAFERNESMRKLRLRSVYPEVWERYYGKGDR